MEPQDGSFRSMKQGGSPDGDPGMMIQARQEDPDRPLHDPCSLDIASKDPCHRGQWKGEEKNSMTPVAAYLREYQETSMRPSVKMSTERKGPLRFLDLPLDILQAILKQVLHTNDLTSLALTCSALHGVVIPLIYSRFDIVWPDALNVAEQRTGVDALTYGIATLVMREDLFENAMLERGSPGHGPCQSFACKQCGNVNYISTNPAPSCNSSNTRRLRRGNYFSQFTKKFSLGNGPPEMVQEYLITKECGKMLGTLVALSVARMPNLETFIWDMPTGILRDIWIALSSLNDHQPSKLKRLWVRFHENRKAMTDAGIPHSGGQASQPAAPPIQTGGTVEPDMAWSCHPVESPNFSTLPPLWSLSVLAIDEIAYLEELSVLIKSSIDKLRTLRLGMASALHTSGLPWEDPRVHFVRSSSALALLMSKILLLSLAERNHTVSIEQSKPTLEPTSADNITHVGSDPIVSDATSQMSQGTMKSDVGEFVTHVDGEAGKAPEPPFLNYASIDPALTQGVTSPENSQAPQVQEASLPDSLVQDIVLKPTGPVTQEARRSPSPTKMMADGAKFAATENSIGAGATAIKPSAEQQKLRLETLELEMMYLSIPVLQKVIHWPSLTRLTLLRCRETDHLWRLLRRTYAPTITRPKSLILSIPTHSLDKRGPQPRLRRMPSSDHINTPQHEYQLNLKSIHTDTVSAALISFLNQTLAPNTLECLFLQDNADYESLVTVGTIFKGPLKRHRASLQKLMLYSAYGASGTRTRSNSAKKWMLTRDILSFITSGKIKKLRELAMVVEYKDWHFFLQRIPYIPHLRSLYVPYIADHVYGSSINIKELAMGVVDVVMLRPEVQLCYLAIATKCFEILETKAKHGRKSSSGGSTTTATASSDTDEFSEDEDAAEDNEHDHDDDDDDDDDGDGDGGGGGGGAQVPQAPGGGHHDEESEVEDEVGGVSADEEEEVRPVRLRLREILFYDDKVAVFKARHGVL